MTRDWTAPFRTERILQMLGTRRFEDAAEAGVGRAIFRPLLGDSIARQLHRRQDTERCDYLAHDIACAIAVRRSTHRLPTACHSRPRNERGSARPVTTVCSGIGKSRGRDRMCVYLLTPAV